MKNINRRNFLQYSSLSLAGVSALSLLHPSRLLANNFSDLMNNSSKCLPVNSQMMHLLNRTGFVVNQQDVELYQRLGYEAYIDYQLDADNIDDSEIENFIEQEFPTIYMSREEMRRKLQNEELNPFGIADELKSATLFRAIHSKKQLFQVMVEFWNNHFSVFHFDGPIRNLKTFEDKEVMREFALSSFGEILHADAQSPAMIYYLDTFSSTKEAPNENYGRELMELHTLSVDGPYTHQDIDEIARCFTGWGINRRTGEFFFSRRNHDDNEKIVLGNIIPAGGGIDDGMQVLDILAAHDSTAEFISKKLCVHFIEDEPSDEIIQSTSQVFKDTGGDIKSVLKHILMSEQFMQASDAKFKRPFHYVASCIGALNGELRTGRRVMRQIKQLLESLGNSPFDWQTPDGYPDYASHWLSTSGMLLRWNFASLFSFGELRGLRYELDTLFTAPFTASNIVNQIQHKIIRRDFELNDKITLLNYLQEDADDDGIVSETKIQAALTIVLSSAYFQLI